MEEFSLEALFELSEIIVTARKRSENLQEVPVSVSSMGREDIERSFARDIGDLQSIAPNLIINKSLAGVGVSTISLRGINFQDIERSFDPALGMVLDGIFLGTNTGHEIQIFDLERIEVLRGPQGTLYGKNSIGGIINIIRIDPTGKLSADIRTRYGNYNRMEFDGVFNFPITSQLAAKLTYTNRQQGEGFVENITRDGNEYSTFDYQSGVVDLLYSPSKSLSIEYLYERQKDRSSSRPLFNFSDSTTLLCNTLLQCTQSATVPQTGDLSISNQNSSSDAFLELDAHTLEVNWDINEGLSLTYLYGQRVSDESVDSDFDSSSIDFFSTIRAQQYEQSSHELRLTSDSTGQINYVAGIYAWDAEYQLDQQILFLLPVVAALPGAISHVYSDQQSNAYAAFFELDYDLTDQVLLNFGGRYTKEEKEFGRGSYTDIPTLPPYPTFDTRSDPVKDSWSEFSPKFSVKYQWQEDLMMYATVSKGFRSGGMNGRANTPQTARRTYDPETLLNKELGLKSSWLDRRLQINLALFFQNYKNKQEDVIVGFELDGEESQETVTFNASEASINGFEMELLALPAQGWTVALNIGTLAANYKSFFADVSGDGTATDNSNLILRRTPELSWSLKTSYERELGPGTASAIFVYRYSDEFQTEFSNHPLGLVDAQGILNAAIGYEHQSWTISLFGRNLTDERGVSQAVLVPQLFTFAASREPRTLGLSANYNWE